MLDTWNNTLKFLRSAPTLCGIFHMLEGFGDITAAEMTDSSGALITRSYREYARLARVTCGALQNMLDISKGDIIGINYPTCMDWPVLFWGVLMAGGIPLLMNPDSSSDQLAVILAESRAVAYISDVEINAADVKCIAASETLGYMSAGENGREDWADMIALYTSGTTGDSRIFLYDGATIATELIGFEDAKNVNNDMIPFVQGSPVKLLACLPFHHIFGLMADYILTSVCGSIIVYPRDKSIQTILAACHKHRITHLYSVPMFFNALAGKIMRQLTTDFPQVKSPRDISVLSEDVRAAVREKTLGNSISVLIGGGGHLPLSTLEVINRIGYPLYNGYGMTEAGIVSLELSRDAQQRMAGSIGNPFSVYEIRIADEGELLIRGDALYAASLKNGVVKYRDREKWFATGDIVKMLNNHICIDGRIKDVIVGAAGENIYPDELEDLFAAIPGVPRIGIIGLKNGEYDEITLVCEEGKTPVDEIKLVQMVSSANDALPAYKKVQRIVFSHKPLPLSGSLKIKRGQLKKEIESGSADYRTVPLSSTPVVKMESSQMCADFIDTAEFNEIAHEVRSVVAEIFGLDEESIDSDANLVSALGGDSLLLVSVVTALESKLDVLISDSEMKNISSVNRTAAIFYAKKHGLNAFAETAEKTVGSRRVTDFRDSVEYIGLQKRKKTAFGDGYNPYFQPHDSLIRDTSVIGGRKVINLGSFNYLGMSGHPETEKAAIDAIRLYGTSASGSRTLAGEKTLYQELERVIAEWKNTEDAIVSSDGWATNLSFVSSFMTVGDFVVYDELSHNSLCEGVALSKAESKAFPHNDLKALDRILTHLDGSYNKVLIIVEGVYSMDGDIAPIPEFVRLKKKHNCFLMVDEAHSSGILGKNGGGVEEYFGLDRHDIDIKFGTLSKALGSCGGYIAADHSIIEYLRYSMSGFVFTTGIAPPLAAAAIKAIEILRRDNSMVATLQRNIKFFVRRMKEEGMNTCLAGESAIVPVLIGSDADAVRLSYLMMQQGVFVPPAMYPAVPKDESRLRFTISATHSIEQLETAVYTLARIMRDEGMLPNKE